MNITWAIGLALWGLLVTVFAASIVRILRELSWHTLGDFCRDRGWDKRLDEIHEEEARVLLGMETLELLSLLLAIWGGNTWWEAATHSTRWHLSLLPLLAGGVVILAVSIWIPRAISHAWGVPILAWTWPVCVAVGKTLQPLAAGAEILAHLAGRLRGDGSVPPTKHEMEKVLENEIRSIVREGIRHGLFQRDALDMIEGVMVLDDNRVNGIMTPRSEMDTLEINMSWDTMLRLVIAYQRTRIPVLKGPDAEDVVGVLYVKDLLTELARTDHDERQPWQELVRPVRYVPVTQPVDELLQQFLRDRNHLAMVRDEFGNVVGLVTIEDALEEIVGEIIDESDEEADGPDSDEIRRIDEVAVEISGRLSITDVNDRLGMRLPENQDFDTLAGFILRRLGRIPRTGECLDWDQFKITIIQATPRQIERLRFEDQAERTRREPART